MSERGNTSRPLVYPPHRVQLFAGQVHLLSVQMAAVEGAVLLRLQGGGWRENLRRWTVFKTRRRSPAWPIRMRWSMSLLRQNYFDRALSATLCRTLASLWRTHRAKMLLFPQWNEGGESDAKSKIGRFLGPSRGREVVNIWAIPLRWAALDGFPRKKKFLDLPWSQGGKPMITAVDHRLMSRKKACAEHVSFSDSTSFWMFMLTLTFTNVRLLLSAPLTVHNS